MNYRLLATCSFGLEAIVKQECINLGFKNIDAFDARVYFDGDETTIAKANLWLRCADRLYIVVDEFEAVTFEELYQGILKQSWTKFIGIDNAFPVTGDAVRSQLFSVTDVQKITKKAIVDKLNKTHNIERFAETKANIPVYIPILKDKVSVLINTSGPGLNRRGYRRINAQAPLRETLAAGLLYIARYDGGPLYDPMCGSGTIIIEAALMAKNVAPGMQRRFAFEQFDFIDEDVMKTVREEAKAKIIKGKVPIYGSDVDEHVLDMAKTHARTAGVFDHISLKKADISKALAGETKGIVVTNPPYAIRLGEAKEVQRLYRKMGNIINPQGYLKAFIISADIGFEKHFGKKADKKRKLYNGSIKCNYYQFFRGKKRYDYLEKKV